MAWKQDIKPNVGIACRPGWCEQYVRTAFGQPAKYATATKAWEGQEDKHTDRKQPGVAVPVYWSLTDNAAGHDAIWLPDGSVWSASHPTATRPMKFASLEAIEKYYGGKLKWRGWGTYVSHKRVAHWENKPKPDQKLHVGEKFQFTQTYRVDDMKLLNDTWQVRTNVLCPKGFTWADNGIPVGPLVEVDSKGNKTKDQRLQTGSRYKIPGTYTVLDMGQYQGRWLAKIKMGGYYVWVDIATVTEV